MATLRRTLFSMVSIRSLLFVALDAALIVFCYWFALFLRLERASIEPYFSHFLESAPIVVAIHIVILSLFQNYRLSWLFVGLNTAVSIGKSVVLSILVCLAILFVFAKSNYLPRFIPIIFGLNAMFLLTSYRFIYRYAKQLRYAKKSPESKRYIIYGAGGAGDILARYMMGQSNFSIIGFVDDDPAKRKLTLQGIPVLGSGQDLKQLVQDHGIHGVIIAMPSASGDNMNDINKLCLSANIKPLVMPGVVEIMTRKNIDLRSLNVTDIIKRTQRNIDIPSIQNFYKDKSVLVTGAGGSIGSELCRQIMASSPKTLIMLDASENNLYKIDMELRNEYSAGDFLRPVLGNASDAAFINRVVEEHRPEFILHAAAYKHVPLGECNPLSFVLNNVLSTYNLVEASIKYDISGFTLISSDKAVNSTNIMGATKRVCELLVYSYFQKSSSCKYSAVRFGNVFGSSGSVVPLFLEQIKGGGPITITDPKMTRYFMSIAEAVGLVLQASTKADEGQLFVLDMGDPILIKELAERLIELSGYTVDKEIKIVYTGIRPGEKLYEELIIEGLENPVLQDGTHVVNMQIPDSNNVLKSIDKLVATARKGSKKETILLLNEIANSEIE